MGLVRTALTGGRSALPFLALIMLGAGLRAWQYFGAAPLWLDELAIAKNIHDFGPWALLSQPLELDQSAPVGFLLLTKASVAVFGDTDLSLRLPPFLAGLILLPSFAALSARVLGARMALIAILLVTISPTLVRYGAEAKPYGLDVCVATLLLLLAVERGSPRSTWEALSWGLAGAVACFVSLPAVLVLGGLGGWLCVQAVSGRSGASRASVLIVLGIWGCVAAATVASASARIPPDLMSRTKGHWGSQLEGYPASFATLAGWTWLPRALAQLQSYIGFSPKALGKVVYGFLTLSGCWVLLRRDYRVLGSLLGPLVCAVIAAVLGRYPLAERLGLFLLPALIILPVAGMESPSLLLGRPWASHLIAGSLLVPALAYAAPHLPVYRRDDVKSMFRLVTESREPGERVLVSPAGWLALERYGAILAPQRGPIQLLACERDPAAGVRRVLSRMPSGRGLWLVLYFFNEELTPEILPAADSLATRLREWRYEPSPVMGDHINPSLVLHYARRDRPAFKGSSALAAPKPGSGPSHRCTISMLTPPWEVVRSWAGQRVASTVPFSQRAN